MDASTFPIGDPRQAGESGPAGDQRKVGEDGPAGDPRPAGVATLPASPTVDGDHRDVGNQLATDAPVADLKPKRSRKS